MNTVRINAPQGRKSPAEYREAARARALAEVTDTTTFWHKETAAHAAGVSVPTLERMIRAGKFPRPVAGIGTRCVRFCPDTVLKWKRDRSMGA